MGFSEVWHETNIDANYFKEIFDQRSKDVFQQNWLANMNENSQCTNYVLFKENLQMEDYLVQLEDGAKYIITKFRTRTHHLPVTNNRFICDNAKDSTCPLCNRG